MDKNLLSKAANQARGLAIDAVHACSSGHLGLPLGAAEIGAVLFSEVLRFDPTEPRWLNRDRFVLSAGHGSMFLYGWLHLAGYDVPLEQVKAFRKLHSTTPGHPEFGETPGVECTTGPLGQGVGNAVGIAVSAKMAAARYNTAEHKIFTQKVVCLAGDGCLQEGVAYEAAAFAGHFALDNLILIYDSNDVTLDAMANATQSEDAALRFQSCGWEVQTINGHDFDAIKSALDRAYAANSGKPQIIIAKTVIAKGIPEVEGSSKGHGEGGAKFAEAARKGLGLPETHFFVSDDVRAHFAKLSEQRVAVRKAWESTFAAWQAANPDKAKELLAAAQGKRPSAEELLAAIPEFPADAKIATRKAGSEVLQPLAKAVPAVVSGSADLHGSTLNYIAGAGDYTPQTPAGRNFRFGIREHGMGAILNGLAYDGLFIPSGATFLTFSDYMRPSIRLAALAKLGVFYIFTHDSVGVGEDGPTHQPVEVTSALRLIPNLDVIRPADPEETAGAFAAAISRADGPTALILSRQNLPTLNSIPAATRREGTLRGGYIARKESGSLDVIIMASGSELQHALAAAEKLGDNVRVVSLPSMERFERQSAEYQESVIPWAVRKRVAIEAGVSNLWWKYVGIGGKVVGIDRFGISAPGNVVMDELGINANKVIEAVQSIRLECPAIARKL